MRLPKRNLPTRTYPIPSIQFHTVIVPISPTFAGVGWRTWLVEDQRFVDSRPDVLTWQTDPLENNLTVTGKIVAQIYASTTGSDADWVVKLIDVYPEHHPEDPSLAGYQLMIASDILRGRFRESVEHPSAIKPGVVTRYRIDLHTNDHAFLKGHRIMVQIQSTWFPLYDLNPQTFVDNIFMARPSDFQKTTNNVFPLAADTFAHRTVTGTIVFLIEGEEDTRRPGKLP